MFLFVTGELLGDTTVKLERADTPDSIGGYEYMTTGKIIHNASLIIKSYVIS